MSALRLLLISAIMLCAEFVLAQIATTQPETPAILLHGDETYYEIGKSIDVLEDPTNKLSFNKVRSGPYASKFKRSNQAIPNFGYSSSDYWLRFRIRNSSDNNLNWILETGNALLSITQFYSIDENGIVEFKEIENQQPIEEREVQHRAAVFALNLKGTEEKTVYLHIGSNDNKLFKAIVWESNAYAKAMNLQDNILSFYFGILLALAAYNLFLFFAIFETSYLYYFLFTFFLALTQASVTGFGFQYLGGELLFNRYTFITYCSLAFTFGIFFSIRFLNVKFFYPTLYQGYKGFMAFLMIVFISLIVGADQQYFLPLYQLSSVSVLINIIVLFITSILIMKKGHRPARYFLLGWSVLFVASIIMLLKHLGYVPVNWFTTYFVRFATTFEALILSLGLADRFRTVAVNLKLKTLETVQLAETEKMKSDFFANISHELRTPLSLIVSPLERLLENKNDPNLEMHKSMHRNGKRLLQLVNQLLYLTKLDNNAVKLRLRETDIIHELRLIASYFDSVAEERNIEFNYSLPEESILTIPFDREKLEIILSNLLSNAFKFTPKGKNVALTLTKDKNHVRISIIDSGIGIHPELQDKIFDRFYQVNNTNVREYEGTGIGLSLVKELVHLHRGTLELKSEPGKGSEFILSLPADARAYRVADFVKEDQTQEVVSYKPVFARRNTTANIENEIISEHSEKCQILIVEDNSDFRAFTKSILQDEYEVIEAANGETGWRIAQDRIPDLIIADMMMPLMDGIELCDKVKRDIKTSHIPVVLLTARQTVQLKIKGFETGADDYLTKPFHVQELLVRVRNLIEQREKLKDIYKRNELPSFDDPILSANERFLTHLTKIIEDNLTSADFDMEMVAGEIGMGRVQLFRKLKAITGQSPSDFIRTYKLNKAAALLNKKAFESISEVAYASGFNSPSHFAESFKKQFGKSPSDYLKQ